MEALRKASLAPEVFRTFGEIWEKDDGRRFPNLHEKFSGEISGKITADLESLDFKFRPCNCNAHAKINGECAFGGKCRAKCIVYKATCKVCREIYIGVTQSDYKQCMTGHTTLLKNYLDEKPDTK
eukprot:12960335-Ditylum_brightwellii.AAC.1